jgi:hypothetical protein
MKTLRSAGVEDADTTKWCLGYVPSKVCEHAIVKF